jgi:hypothetical protein
MQDQKEPVVKGKDDSLPDTLHAANDPSVDHVQRWNDGTQHEGIEQLDPFKAVADQVPPERLDVNDYIWKFRQRGIIPAPDGCCLSNVPPEPSVARISVPSQPFHDLFARPVMIVVQVQDNGIEREPFMAPHRTSAAYVLETIEDPMEPRVDGVGVLREDVSAFVSRTERARAAMIVEILAEGLKRPASGAFRNRSRQLELIFARDLMHRRSSSRPGLYASVTRGASVRNRTVGATHCAVRGACLIAMSRYQA